MRTLIAAVGAVAAAAALVPGCSIPIGSDGKPVVSREALQTEIADRLTKAGEQPESVTCREDLVGEVGKTARCEVVMSPTNSFEPVVAVTRIDGTTVDYEMTPAVSKEQLEKAVSRLVSAASGVQVETVLCESGLQGNVGAVAYCDVGAGGVKLRRTIEVNRVDGLMMNFDVVPLLTKAEVERSLLDELGSQGRPRPDSAQCSGNLEGRPGNTVDCTIVAGAEAVAFTLTVTTVQGNKINYRYQPKD
ncbi:DUF4333 domain-containing protein [Mycobacterium sp.]|uniref:DUF4333 domain-containing protein n=1 Tax=Mycobacterium sp. TaxID=1785 RepID=UPI002DB02C34|nr:DUF4333 domain-containing protein [Mycobacterium sp.]